MTKLEPGQSDVAGWWNINRAATYLGVSVAFLRKGVRLKRIPFVRVGSKIVRFRRTELDQWLKQSPGLSDPDSFDKKDQSYGERRTT